MYTEGAMRRTKEEATATRRRLLTKALIVFSSKGYAGATLDDIAREAGVTRGAIYWHFGGKADLYNTLVDEYTGRANNIMQQAVSEGGTLLDILERVFVQQLQAIEDDRELRAMMELALFKTERVAELEEGRKKQIDSGLALIEMMAGVLAQGTREGFLRDDIDPKRMAQAYLAFQNGLIQLWLTSPSEFSLEEEAKAFAAILMAGLRLQPS
jgi:TetR/AcrR family acrAB operon transcriptional repressor